MVARILPFVWQVLMNNLGILGTLQGYARATILSPGSSRPSRGNDITQVIAPEHSSW